MEKPEPGEYVPQPGDYCRIKQGCGHPGKYAKILTRCTREDGKFVIYEIAPDDRSMISFEIRANIISDYKLKELKLTTESREENNRLVKALIVQEFREAATKRFNEKLEAALAEI